MKDDINNHECNDLLRTQEAYNSQVAAVEKDTSLTPFYGIKNGCALNELEYFHIVDGAPQDVAHDVLEGFAIDSLSPLLLHYIHAKVLTVAEINRRINEFEYTELDRRNKPQPLNEKKPLKDLRLRETACEMWNLIRLFPLMFGDIAAHDDAHWQLCLKFVRLVELLCSPIFNEQLLCKLDDDVKVFPKAVYTPIS